MRVKLSQLQANSFRDMNKYPISDEKVDALVESIKQTDFWDNLLARVVGNELDGQDNLAAYLKGLPAAFDEDGTPLFTVELAYGHHRWVACQKAGIEEIDIPVKMIDDETMLRIMANENKGDWSSNMLVILETVRQVRNSIAATIAPYEDFEAYEEAGHTFFSKSKPFMNAKSQGVGYKTTAKFLGESWSENDIRNTYGVLESIDAGLFEQETVVPMSSTGMIARFNKLSKAVDEQEWPQYFKTAMIQDSADYITDENSKATVKVVDLAAGAVKKGNDPLTYLAKQKRVEFDLAKAVRPLLEDKKLSVEEVNTLIGEFEGLDEAILKAQESIAKAEARAAAKEAGDEPPVEGTEDPSADQAEVDAAVAEAESIEEVDPGIVGDVAEDGRYSIDTLTETVIGSAGVFGSQCDLLVGRIGEVGDDDQRFYNALNVSFNSVCALMLETYGMAEVKKVVDELEKIAVNG